MSRTLQDRRIGLRERAPKQIVFEMEEHTFRDERFDLRPSEIVQSKLMGILPSGMAIPVSSLHISRSVRR